MTITFRRNLSRKLTKAEADANWDDYVAFTTLNAQNLAGKQDKLIAGANINIALDGRTISAVGTGSATPLVDDLVTGGNAAALTAQQGVVLKGITDTLNSNLTGKQATLTGVGDVPGLVTALSQKQPNLTGVGDVPGLSTALAGKAADLLTGLNTGSAVDVNAGDTVLIGFGKLQAKFNAIATTIRGTVLTGLSVATSTDVTSADTVLSALGKLQAKFTAGIGTQFALLTDRVSFDIAAINDSIRNALAGKATLGLVVEDVPTTTYTVTTADKGKAKNFSHASGCNVTFNTGLGADFAVLLMKDPAGGTVTMTPGSGVGLTSDNGALTLSQANAQATVSATKTLNSFAVKGNTGAAGTADVSGPSASVDSELAIFNGTSGKIIKRASTSGILKATAGVLAAAVAGTDYYAPGGGDVAVADGGTGVSAMVAYSVICGGTTNAGALQALASVGTNGQVLTSSGPGSLPTWQTPSGGSTALVIEDVAGTTYTVVAGDQGKAKRFVNASGCAVTINTGLGAGFNFIALRSSAAGLVTFSGTATLAAANGSGSLVMNGRMVSIAAEATDTYLIGGTMGGKVFAASGKTFTVNNTLTLQGTDSSTIDAGAGGTIAYKDKQTIATKAWIMTPVALSDSSGTINTDASLGNTFTVTLTGTGRTLANPTNLTNGQQVTWRVKEDATGSRTITTYGSMFSWGTAGAPTLSTVAGKVDYLTGYYDSTDNKVHMIANLGF